jgi:hypothetical protein
MFNHLIYLIDLQCVPACNVHEDLCWLSYGSIIAKSYGRYDVNEFHFCSTIFEASHPLVATTNTRVVTMVIDAEGHESKYYGIIKNIIEYNFARNKNLKTVSSIVIGLIPFMVLVNGYTPLSIPIIMKIKWQLERLMRFIKMMNCHVHLI